MVRVIEAIYEGGVLKPLADPGLPEHQRVVLEIRMPGPGGRRVLPPGLEAGLRGALDDDVTEIERIALDHRPRLFDDKGQQ